MEKVVYNCLSEMPYKQGEEIKKLIDGIFKYPIFWDANRNPPRVVKTGYTYEITGLLETSEYFYRDGTMFHYRRPYFEVILFTTSKLGSFNLKSASFSIPY